MPLKITTVLGARPQFIKAAAFQRAILSYNEKNNGSPVQSTLIHTGQHYDENMSAAFFSELQIPEPDVNLGIGSGPHGWQTGRMIEAVEKTLLDHPSDLVLVYGDTNSTLAGALAAAKLRLPVVHVEAGLRIQDRKMAEEINRVLTDQLSDVLFTPCEAASRFLRGEGIPEERIVFSGDVMYDNTLYYADHLDRDPEDVTGLKKGSYVLFTFHRAENTDRKKSLGAIVEALKTLSAEIDVIIPIHPRTRAALAEANLLADVEKSVRVVEPAGYLQMLSLIMGARTVVSDSGGIPREAFYLGIPSVTLRPEAIWTELVDLGWTRTVEPESAGRILSTIHSAMDSQPGKPGQPYGDGRSARRILDELVRRYA
jgi:UDP-GlcNAc3NAcA epimerase